LGSGFHDRELRLGGRCLLLGFGKVQMISTAFAIHTIGALALLLTIGSAFRIGHAVHETEFPFMAAGCMATALALMGCYLIVA
jgi:hypothetical protein